MKVIPIQDPLAGEQVIEVHPTMRPEVDAGWHRRLNFYTGRSLSDVALITEQNGRAGRLTTLGQSLSPGVVSGLTVARDTQAAGTTGEDPRLFFHLDAGLGLAASGEDVVVNKPVRFNVWDLPVYMPSELLDRFEQGGGDVTPITLDLGGIYSRAMGPSIREAIGLNSGLTNNSLPKVAILALQPVVAGLRREVDPNDPCERDPLNDAFEDWQVVDGVRVFLYAWPADWRPLPPPDPSLPEPALDPRWRNRLAHTIFDAEKEHGPDQVLPWEEVGVPVGLVAFDNDWTPVFLDRYSVVRAGGKPKRRTSPVSGAGNPFMWQARMQQFAEQVADAALANTPTSEMLQQFRYLAPAGLLPKDAITPREHIDNFFPSNYYVEAVPVPLEQLDIAFESSASLDAFDSFTPDRVRVLVPTPQVWYDPDLLHEEQPSPEFDASISEFVHDREEWLHRRDDVRNKESAITKSITGEAKVYDDPEPPEPEAPGTDTLAPPEDGFGTTEQDPTATPPLLTVDGITALKGSLQGSPLSPEEIAVLDNAGLEEFIQDLEEKVKAAEDQIDLGFVRVQADIYRVRQLMLGTDAGSRLATSPALAQIIAAGESAVTTKQDLQLFVERLKNQAPPGGQGGAAPSGAGPEGGPTGGSPEGAPAGGSSAESAPTTARVAFTGDLNIAGGGITSIPIVEIPTAFSFEKNVEDAIRTEQLLLGTTGGVLGGSRVQASKEQILDKSPIVGKPLDFRTLTVTDRLDEPKAAEAKNYSVATKYEIIRGLAGLAEPSAPGKLGLTIGDLEVPGFYEYAPDGSLRTRTVQAGGRAITVPLEGRRSFTQIIADDFALANEILVGRHDPDPTDGDESAFFSAAVRALDHAAAALRIMEGRVRAYQHVISLCRNTLEQLNTLITRVAQRLLVIEDELAEARHDVAVARALKAEEVDRVGEINRRRDAIIDEFVPFLAFHRPRVTDLIKSPVPVRPLDPGLVEPAVPACLARDVDVPEELKAMVNLFRDVPLKWLVHVARLLDKLDRLDILKETIQFSQTQSFQKYIAKQPPKLVNLPSSTLSQSINTMFQAQQQIVVQQAQKRSQANLSLLAGLSWKHIRTQAEELVTLDDLSSGVHGRSDVAKRANQELDDIAQVASCLYSLFGEVVPAIRLDWAERLSQFDSPVNLRNLSSLPRWRDPLIEYLQRQAMQSLVDWLYHRVDVGQPEAVAMMNDLVRVCILLSSHAPVNEIIAGHVQEAATVKPGDEVKIRVPLRKVHIGMHVLMYSQDRTEILAQGVVQDMADDQVGARITKSKNAAVQLAKDAQVQFGSPGAFSKNPLISKAIHDGNFTVPIF